MRPIGNGRKHINVEVWLGEQGLEVFIEGNRILDEELEQKFIDLVSEDRVGRMYLGKYAGGE